MSDRTILVWFRKDLRIHDNEILIEAVRKSDRIIPVYCFDPRQFEQTSFQTRKTGILRAQFLLESVSDLRSSFKELGADLLVRIGRPEDVIPELVEKYNVQEVYHHREVASEETRVSADVENALWRLKINLRHFIGHTLYHKEDLPFPIKSIPDVFASFRKKVERDSVVRSCFDSPESVNVPDSLELGNIPTLVDLGFTDAYEANGFGSVNPTRTRVLRPARATGNWQLATDAGHLNQQSVIPFKGGEKAAMQRMQDFFWNSDSVKSYKQNRLRIRGENYSSKFSPWISMGCLSPREVYWEIKKYERERGTGDYAHSLYLELLSRDFYRFMFKKHGNKFFRKTGFKSSSPVESANQQELFKLWRAGKTEVPIIDALMTELNSTGFISGKGRQILADYLVYNLQVNWMLGAAWFEEKLIDYDPASNWGNWANLAGVGTDIKPSRQTDISKITSEVDPNGEYIKLWASQSTDTALLNQ